MSKSCSEKSIPMTSECKLNIKVPNISKLVEYWSAPAIIHDLNWSAQIMKAAKASNSDEKLSVYLHCTNNERSSNWNCAAWATVKLVSLKEENSITKPINPDVYDSMSGWGISDFIAWSDLFDEDKEFVHNDEIELEMLIRASVPVIVDKNTELFESLDRCCASASRGRFRWTVNNVGELLAACSPQFFLRGLPWELSVFRIGTTTGCSRDMFGISLRCKNSNPNWSWKVTIMLSFLTPTEHGMKPSFVQNINECIFNSENPNASYVLLWKNLFKPEHGILNNNSAVIECEIRLQNPINAINPRKRRFQVEMVCAICLDNIVYQRVSTTKCGHIFCTECIERAIAERNHCPMCNTENNLNNLRRLHLPMWVFFRPLYVLWIFFNNFTPFPSFFRHWKLSTPNSTFNFINHRR